MTVQKGWKIDVNQCISCRACEMACKVEYDLQAGQGRRRRVIEKTVVETPGGKPRTFFTSLACNHCENPACLAACPKGAYTKDVDGSLTSLATKGVVLHDPAKCIGCRRCEWACPYGAPQYNPTTQKVHKCEMCWQRVANPALHASRKVPACVATCIGQAIKLMDVDTDQNVADGNLYLREDNATTFDPRTAAGIAAGTGAGQDPGFVPAGDPGTATTKGRGSKYLASASLTGPALRIRNRVYLKRTPAGEVE